MQLQPPRPLAEFLQLLQPMAAYSANFIYPLSVRPTPTPYYYRHHEVRYHRYPSCIGVSR